MRNLSMARINRLVVCTLGAFAVVAPAASADTTAPVWTCRASAAYVESPLLDPLLGTRLEPIQANGFPDRDAPDRAQCATADAGVPAVTVPDPVTPLLTLQAPFARTSITPELGAARDQTATATGGVADPVTVDLGGLVISATGVSSQAAASCVAGSPQLTGSSTVVALTVNGNVINIPTGQNSVVFDPLQPLLRIVLNEQVVAGDATTPDQALTQRAVHVQLLQALNGPPLVNVVLGESKVDRHGATCAAAPPPPTCPAGSVAQAGSSPLVCAVTVTAPCPAGSTADPNAGGACVILRTGPPAPCPAGSTADPNAGGACVVLVQAPPASCPAPSVRDPKTNNCILPRPCPAESKPDAQTGVCVLSVPTTGSGNGVNGSNGGVGSVTGPRVTCGRLKMHFVRNNKTSLSQRYGTRLVTRGTLVTCGSNPRPIVGARIDVVHVIGGKRQLVKTGLRSRPGGRMTLILPLNLKTRTIEFAYRPDLTSRRVSSRANLRLTVRSNLTGRVLR